MMAHTSVRLFALFAPSSILHSHFFRPHTTSPLFFDDSHVMIPRLFGLLCGFLALPSPLLFFFSSAK
jgi:hypothetical protein